MTDTPKIVFITGDRSINPLLGIEAVGSLVSQIGANALVRGQTITLMTGDNDGVEWIVREFLASLSVKIETLETPKLEDGTPDWDTRSDTLENVCDQVFFVHSDPLASSIGKSLVAHVSEDKLVIPLFE